MPGEPAGARIGVFAALCVLIVLVTVAVSYSMYRWRSWMRRRRQTGRSTTETLTSGKSQDAVGGTRGVVSTVDAHCRARSAAGQGNGVQPAPQTAKAVAATPTSNGSDAAGAATLLVSAPTAEAADLGTLRGPGRRGGRDQPPGSSTSYGSPHDLPRSSPRGSENDSQPTCRDPSGPADERSPQGRAAAHEGHRQGGGGGGGNMSGASDEDCSGALAASTAVTAGAPAAADIVQPLHAILRQQGGGAPVAPLALTYSAPTPPSHMRSMYATRALFESYNEREIELRLRQAVFGPLRASAEQGPASPVAGQRIAAAAAGDPAVATPVASTSLELSSFQFGQSGLVAVSGCGSGSGSFHTPSGAATVTVASGTASWGSPPLHAAGHTPMSAGAISARDLLVGRAPRGLPRPLSVPYPGGLLGSPPGLVTPSGPAGAVTYQTTVASPGAAEAMSYCVLASPSCTAPGAGGATAFPSDVSTASSGVVGAVQGGSCSADLGSHPCQQVRRGGSPLGPSPGHLVATPAAPQPPQAASTAAAAAAAATQAATMASSAVPTAPAPATASRAAGAPPPPTFATAPPPASQEGLQPGALALVSTAGCCSSCCSQSNDNNAATSCLETDDVAGVVGSSCGVAVAGPSAAASARSGQGLGLHDVKTPLGDVGGPAGEGAAAAAAAAAGSSDAWDVHGAVLSPAAAASIDATADANAVDPKLQGLLDPPTAVMPPPPQDGRGSTGDGGFGGGANGDYAAQSSTSVPALNVPMLKACRSAGGSMQPQYHHHQAVAAVLACLEDDTQGGDVGEPQRDSEFGRQANERRHHQQGAGAVAAAAAAGGDVPGHGHSSGVIHCSNSATGSAAGGGAVCSAAMSVAAVLAGLPPPDLDQGQDEDLRSAVVEVAAEWVCRIPAGFRTAEWQQSGMSGHIACETAAPLRLWPQAWPASGAANLDGPLAKSVAERLMTSNPLYQSGVVSGRLRREDEYEE